jgi:hypothetical protein
MSKYSFKPSTLRNMMKSLIIVMIGLSAFGFYYVQGELSTLATSIGDTISQTKLSGADSQIVETFKQEIAEAQQAADKASLLTTSVQNHQSQSITKDLDKYAADTNIKITGYDYTQPTNLSAPKLTDGIVASYLTITLTNPVPFTNFMQFLRLIESNTPKMQITGISLKHSPGSPADTVTVEPLIIEIYTR